MNIIHLQNNHQNVHPNNNFSHRYNDNINLNGSNNNLLSGQSHNSSFQKNELNLSQSSQNEKIFTFYNEQFLSDSVLKMQNKEKIFHSLVLSSASGYIYDFFKVSPNKDKGENKYIVPFPEHNISEVNKDSSNEDECLNILFKFCYANQNFSFVQKEITYENIFNILSFAHCLRMKSLLHYLEKKIINEMLNFENCFKLFKESLLFELPSLKEKALKIIASNFKEVHNSETENHILNWNYDTFKGVMSNDYLQIQNEREVSELVIKYIKFRRGLPEEKIMEKDKSNLNDIQDNPNGNNPLQEQQDNKSQLLQPDSNINQKEQEEKKRRTTTR